jgi:hypothetical protein
VEVTTTKLIFLKIGKFNFFIFHAHRRIIYENSFSYSFVVKLRRKNASGLGSMNKTDKCQWRAGVWEIRGGDGKSFHLFYFMSYNTVHP